MPRRMRLALCGFHYIVNRGVDKNKVFKSNEDKDKFLDILCKACHIYKVDLHNYCLMDNHYRNANN